MPSVIFLAPSSYVVAVVDFPSSSNDFEAMRVRLLQLQLPV